jgi:hypothetical protein
MRNTNVVAFTLAQLTDDPVQQDAVPLAIGGVNANRQTAANSFSRGSMGRLELDAARPRVERKSTTSESGYER